MRNETQSESIPAIDDYFNPVLKLIALHLIRNALTLLDDGKIPTESLGDIEKQRAAIDADIKEQQMIVDRLLDNTTPQQANVGVAYAATYPSCLPKARMH